MPRLLARLADAVLILIVLAVVTAGWVGCVRWYTDGTHDCANCSPE